jgi:hypothetical protein
MVEFIRSEYLEPACGIQRQYSGTCPQQIHIALAATIWHLPPLSLSSHALCSTGSAAAARCLNFFKESIERTIRAAYIGVYYCQAVGKEGVSCGQAGEQLLLGLWWWRLRVGERRQVRREETRPDGIGVGCGTKGRGHRGYPGGVTRPPGGEGDNAQEDVRRQLNVVLHRFFA